MSKLNIKRRDFLKWSGAATSMVLLAACSPKTAEPAPSGDSAKPEEQPAEKTTETVKLKFQSREAEVPEGMMEMWKVFYPAFRDEHPDIEVEYLSSPPDLAEALLAQMVAGDCADMVEICCWHTQLFIQKGETYNLQPLIDRDADEVQPDDFYEHAFDLLRDAKGDINSMPRFTGTFAIFYNKDMFDEMGVEYPSHEWGGWTFEDYRRLGLEFVKRDQPMRWGTSNYGLGANWLSQVYLWGWGANMVDPEDNTRCALGDPNAQECLEWMRKFIWDDKVFAIGAEMGGLGVQELFLGGKIAMMEMGPWGLDQVKDGAPFNWDIASFPSGPRFMTTLQGTNSTFMWAGSKHVEEAWTFIKEYSSPEFEEMYAKFCVKQPSRMSVVDKFATILRESDSYWDELNVECFADSMKAGAGRDEGCFAKDAVSKNQILGPAFDQVMKLGQAPAQLIAEHAEIATRFNRDEIAVEDLGAAIEALQK